MVDSKVIAHLPMVHSNSEFVAPSYQYNVKYVFGHIEVSCAWDNSCGSSEMMIRDYIKITDLNTEKCITKEIVDMLPDQNLAMAGELEIVAYDAIQFLAILNLVKSLTEK